MAVYEQLYGAYEGVPQSAMSRFLVIPRYALRDIFKSKLVTGMFLVCFVYPLIAAILVYLRHNANAVAILQIDVLEVAHVITEIDLRRRIEGRDPHGINAEVCEVAEL